MPQKVFASGDRPLLKKFAFVFGLNFWPLGASSPLVTPISGYEDFSAFFVTTEIF